MATFWDEIVRTFTGGSSTTPRKAVSNLKRPTPTRPQAVDSRPVQNSAVRPSLGGNGGSGGGGFAMSRPTSTEKYPREDETPKQSPWDSFIYGQNKQGQQRFQEDSKPKPNNPLGEKEYSFGENLFAWLTTPVEDNVFKSPGIGGAAERKDEFEAKKESLGLKPRDIPSNYQLKELGMDDDTVNIDGNLVPLNNTAEQNQFLRDEAAKADRNETLESLEESFGSGSELTVRELTNEEWAALSPSQQQGVIASWALYQAAEADREAFTGGEERFEGYDEAVNSAFSEGRGSDTYAPRTVEILQNLSYSNPDMDLDYFLNNSAIPTYEDILGKSIDPNSGTRADVFDSLSNSALFSSESITNALSKGQSILDALQVSGQVSDSLREFSAGQPELYESLTPEDFSRLDILARNLASRDVNARLVDDYELNNRLAATIDEAKQVYGDDLIVNYFMDSIRNNTDSATYMTPEEFSAAWLEG